MKDSSIYGVGGYILGHGTLPVPSKRCTIIASKGKGRLHKLDATLKIFAD
jgi:hypothetical protein